MPFTAFDLFAVIVTTLPTAPLIGLTAVIVAAVAVARAAAEERVPPEAGPMNRRASTAVIATA